MGRRLVALAASAVIPLLAWALSEAPLQGDLSAHARSCAADSPQPDMAAKLPTLFLPHGGGPLPLLGDKGHAKVVRFLKAWPATLPAQPKALLVISGHWEEPELRVTSAQQPQILYDYYGFPEEGYRLTYPAPGDPALAGRVASLLAAAGLPCKADARRGLDHGVWVPLKLMFPKADVPVVALSLLASLDPEEHIRVGAALAPLREEGVLILGSGLSFHNVGALMAGGPAQVGPASQAFDEYLRRAVESPEEPDRTELLLGWRRAPHAGYAHPREEHLVPLFVAFGAAGGAAGRTVFSDALMSATTSAFQWG